MTDIRVLLDIGFGLPGTCTSVACFHFRHSGWVVSPISFKTVYRNVIDAALSRKCTPIDCSCSEFSPVMRNGFHILSLYCPTKKMTGQKKKTYRIGTSQ